MANEVFPILTRLGRDALINSNSTGIELEFVAVEFGEGQYVPGESMKKLKLPQRLVPITSIKPLGDRSEVFNISVLLDGPNKTSEKETFYIGEIGIIAENTLATGDKVRILFSILSREGDFYGQKLKDEPYIFTSNFALTEVDSGSVTVSPPSLNLNMTLAVEFAELATEVTKMRQEIMELRQVVDRNQRV